MIDGILFVNKPKDMTSRDVVNRVSKIYHTKKVGHTGTLDPLATGVLILCLGKYTKLVQELTSEEKEYVAVMKLGYLTDTLDVTGTILKEKKVQVSQERICSVFQNFPKEYWQTVPLYSAVKINGKKLYEYARENEEVELPKRKVQIKNLEILKIEKDTITFKTTVSKGTYIRSLIKDLASEMQEYGVMQELTRTKQGNFHLEDCSDLEDISENTPLKKLEDLFSYPRVQITEEIKKRIQNGNVLYLEINAPRVLLMNQENAVAIYEKCDSCYKMVFKVI